MRGVVLRQHRVEGIELFATQLDSQLHCPASTTAAPRKDRDNIAVRLERKSGLPVIRQEQAHRGILGWRIDVDRRAEFAFVLRGSDALRKGVDRFGATGG